MTTPFLPALKGLGVHHCFNFYGGEQQFWLWGGEVQQTQCPPWLAKIVATPLYTRAQTHRRAGLRQTGILFFLALIFLNSPADW